MIVSNSSYQDKIPPLFIIVPMCVCDLRPFSHFISSFFIGELLFTKSSNKFNCGLLDGVKHDHV